MIAVLVVPAQRGFPDEREFVVLSGTCALRFTQLLTTIPSCREPLLMLFARGAPRCPTWELL
jgi:hypothetical protein